jgi:Mrp family chromosome partitioning ATPase
LLESYLAKYREATARDNIGATSPDARIISTAVVSSVPSWPKKLPTVLVAALGMLALSVGFVLTGELLNTVPVQPAVAPAFDYKPTVIPPAVEPVARERRMASPPLQSQMAPHAGPAAHVPSDSIEGLAAELASAGEAGRRISVVGARRNMGATQATITLARALAKSARVVLVDLALDAPGLSAIASDPSGPGISELIRGSASFGQIVTRDRYSRVHVVTAGGVKGDSAAIFNAQRLSITLEALGRSYDYVVVDAGALRDAPTERIAQFATRAVLVADELDDPATASAREALLAAGFANVSVLVNPPQGPQSDSSGTRAAA